MTDDPDLSEFLSAPRGPKGCVVGHALHSLDDDNARKLRKALDTPDVRHSRIEQWLRDRDVRVYVGAVARHRQKTCSCEEHGLA